MNRDHTMNINRQDRKSLKFDAVDIRTLAIVVFFLAIIAYLPSLKTNFVWDSEVLYTQYEGIRGLYQLKNVFSSPAIAHQEGDGERFGTIGYYRPLAKAWSIVGLEVFGENPFAFKLTSLLLHAVVCVLVLLMVYSVTSRPLMSGVAAVLFAVNPIHIEAVVWVYSVSYLLLTAFSLLTVIFYNRGKMALAFGTYCAALLSHELGVLLLPTLLLHSWLLGNKRRLSEYVPLIPFAIALVLYLALRASVVGPLPLTEATPVEFINTAAVISMRYLKILLWPDAAVTVYLIEDFSDFSLGIALAYLGCFSLLALAYRFFRRDRESLFWLLWFGVWISVSFNSGRTGEYLMAEKILYMASIGIYALIGSGFQYFFENRIRLLAACLMPILAIYTYETWHRISFWQDTKTYLEAALEHAPGFYLAHYQLALFAIQVGDHDEAESRLYQTIKFKQTFSPAVNNLGNVFYVKGNLDSAIVFWERAIVLDPSNPMPYFNIGLVHNQKGQVEDAQRFFDKYLEEQPNPPPNVVSRLKSLGYWPESAAETKD
jgi:tetratricopeptide (TPR) repeat protein